MKSQPAPKVSRADVVRIVRRDFSLSHETGVFAILDRYGTSAYQRERDRVHLAILKLANGDLDTLRQNTDIACSDHRDVIIAAEYPAYSAHGWSTPLRRGERSKIYEMDWNQYDEWLHRNAQPTPNQATQRTAR